MRSLELLQKHVCVSAKRGKTSSLGTFLKSGELWNKRLVELLHLYFEHKGSVGSVGSVGVAAQPSVATRGCCCYTVW